MTYSGSLFGATCPVSHVAAFLDANHYLGRARRGIAWSDEFGVLVLASPTSRHLPTDWLGSSAGAWSGNATGGRNNGRAWRSG